MATFFLKYRDTRPILEVTLLDPDETAHDLTGVTGVKLHIKREDGTVITKDMVVDGTPSTGIVRYTWLAADWTSDLVVGTHQMEYEVLGPSTGRLSFPNWRDDVLVISDDLGQG